MAGSEVLERTAKLEVPRSFEQPAVDGVDVLEDRQVDLQATYWDTSDLRLLWIGATLRHRSASDGSESGWTVELPVAADGVHEGLDVAFDGEAAIVPTAALTLLRGLLFDRQLGPIATVSTTRRVRELRDPVTGATLGVADDIVISERDGQSGPSFREIEIEIEVPDDVGKQAARRLIAEFRRAGARRSRRDPDVRHVLASRSNALADLPKLRSSSTAEDLVRRSIADGLRRLLTNDPTIRASGSIEAIHQARVATRRLRSDLKSLELVLDTDRTDAIRAELGWLARLLGTVRDADVIGDTLRDAARALAATPAGTAALLDRLAEQRDLAHLTLVDAMTSSRYLTLIDHLRRATEHPPLIVGSQRARPTVKTATDHAYRRVEKLARRMPTKPPDEERHELRKRAKRARYAAELATPLLGKQTATLADRLADLQTALGEHQDGVVARQWLEALDLDHTGGAEAFAAGQLHERLTAGAKQPVPWRKALRRADRERPR